MEWGKIRTAPPPKPVDQFGCRFKHISMSTYGVDVQNLIKIDSAVAAVHKREKTGLGVGFGRGFWAWDFGRGFLGVGFWATVCKMVRPMLSGRCIVCTALSCPVSL